MGFVWRKLNKKAMTPFIGLGRYTRSNEEYCIIGTKGQPGSPKRHDISQSISSPVREHSRKPDEIRDYIAAMYDGPRIELFSRMKYPGWDCFGNQTDRFETNSLFDCFVSENELMSSHERT
jgi:N6-adenosine-specific RNA methylase IME4